MNKLSIKTALVAIALTLILGFALIARGGMVSSSFAAGPDSETGDKIIGAVERPSPSLRTITVVGEGSITIEPDLARATIGVETIGDTVEEVTQQSAETMQELKTALKDEGIAERDIQTSGYNLWTDRSFVEPPQPQGEEIIYRVNNTVSVVIRDLDKVGEVLDAAITAGANTIHGVQFSVDEPRELAGEAREKAISDAKAKAQHLAELNDLELGALVRISEVVGSGGGYYSSNLSQQDAMLQGMGGGAGPISPGELELSLNLEVIYTLVE